MQRAGGGGAAPSVATTALHAAGSIRVFAFGAEAKEARGRTSYAFRRTRSTRWAYSYQVITRHRKALPGHRKTLLTYLLTSAALLPALE